MLVNEAIIDMGMGMAKFQREYFSVPAGKGAGGRWHLSV
jgi:hypothetical protein